jgi:outer membrane protein assembly factor BamB
VRRIVWLVLSCAVLAAPAAAVPPPGGEATSDAITPGRTFAQPESTLEPPFYIRWSRHYDNGFTGPALIADGRIFIRTSSDLAGLRLEALDPTSGDTLWSTPTTGTSLAYDTGRVFSSEYGGATAAFEAATGTPLWAVAGGGEIVAEGGRVYVAGPGPIIEVRDGATGALLWSVPVLPGQAPALSPTSVLLADACGGGSSLDSATGAVQWQTTQPGCLAGTLSAYIDGSLLGGLGSATVAVFDPASGAAVRSFPVVARSSMAVSRGVLVSNAAGIVTAYDVATGAAIWSRDTRSYSDVRPIIVGNTVVFMEVRTNVPGTDIYLFDLQTGATRAVRPLPLSVVEATAGEGLILLFGGHDVFAVDSTFRREPGELAFGAFAPAANTTWEAFSEDNGIKTTGVALRRGTRLAVSVDRSSARVYVGGIDGDRLVYQRIRRPNSRGDAISIWNLKTRKRTPLGRFINDGAWLWNPTISGRYVLYAHGDSRATHSVALADLRRKKVHVLARGNPKKVWVAPGQVSGDFAVWTSCRRGHWCTVTRRTISTGHKVTIHTAGADIYAPAVTPDGIVYALVSGRESGCPATSLARWRNGVLESLYRTPSGQNADRPYASPLPGGYIDVRYELWTCDNDPRPYAIDGVVDRPSLPGIRLGVARRSERIPLPPPGYAAPPGSVTTIRQPLG